MPENAAPNPNTLFICANEEHTAALTAILNGEYTVCVPKSGDDVFTAAKNCNPVSILLDITIPLYFDALTAFVSCPNLNSVPIIAILPNCCDGDELILPGEIKDYISTPFIANVVKFRVRNSIQLIIAENTAVVVQHNLKRNRQMLYAVSNAAALLLNSDENNFADTIRQSLQIIAEAVMVDRMYIFRNHTKYGELHFTKQYEWTTDTCHDLSNEIGLDISFEGTLERWENLLSSGKTINCITRNLPGDEYEFFKTRKILSVLVEPIIKNGKLWGFIGFDDCRTERVFTNGEESILRSSSLLIANVFTRTETIETINDTRNKLVYREMITDTLNQSAVSIVTQSEGNFAQTMTRAITPLAKVVDVDCVSVWRNFEKDGTLCSGQVYLWEKRHGGTTKPDERFASVSYKDHGSFMIKHFYDANILNSPVKHLPNPELFMKSGVKSIFAAPMFIRGRLWGFVMFDDRRNERTFEDDFVYLMRNASFLIAGAVMRDIAEREVIETEERIKLMLDSTPLCCQLWDEELNILDCNEAAVKLFGLSSKDEYIKRYYRLLPKTQPCGKRSVNILAENLTKAFEHGEVTFEWLHNNFRGEPIPAEVTLKRVAYHNTMIVAGYTRDLREQKEMLADIKMRDKLLQTINNAALVLLNSGTATFNDDMKHSLKMIAELLDIGDIYIWKNDYINGKLHCSELYNYQTNDANVMQNRSFCYDDYVSDWYEALSAGEYINGPAYDMCKEAQDYMAENSVLSTFIVPLFIEQQFWGFLGFDDFKRHRKFPDVDVSVLRSSCLLFVYAILRNDMLISLQDSNVKLEFAYSDANEASRAKSVFLANMSHEIRTPMNSIIGLSELALMEEVPPKTKSYLSSISENSELLLHIINDILDLSKIEAGKIALVKKPFNIKTVLSRCRASTEHKAVSKGLGYYCYADNAPGKHFVGDSFKLTQVLVNLLSNAIKFTETGEIQLASHIVESNNETAVLRFEVVDSGIGMTPEQLVKIFDPFIQADDTTERKFGGTGLGLTIAKSIVEIMGGQLEVESTPGKGSRFWFELQFELVDSTNINETQAVELDELSMPTFSGLVLVCEDNVMNRQVISDHLNKVGLDFVIAENGFEGVQLVETRLNAGKTPFDLIFMDIHMPVMNGLKAAEKIIELGVETPMIALTANAFPEDVETYKARGMQGYLGKPFKAKELWHCLLQHLQPAKVVAVNKKQMSAEEADLHQKLTINFVKSNQHTYFDIENAITNNNFELAHRLAHTLKSNAGQIGETKLQTISAEVEHSLNPAKHSGNTVPSGRQMNELHNCLTAVLQKYSHLLSEKLPAVTEIEDENEALALLANLSIMLENNNPECMNYTNSLNIIPHSDELVRLIEQFEFADAAAELERIVNKLMK